MRIAAVIVNFRTAAATIAAVKSLQRSSRRVDNVIVVDNASSDGSADAILEGVPTVRLLASASNGGFAAGCNLGIVEARSQGATHVLLLNSDAIVAEDCLDALERQLAADQSIGIAGAVLLTATEPRRIESRGITVSTTTGRVLLRDFGKRYEPARMTTCEIVPAVSGCAMLITADVLDRVGLLREDYFWGLEDVDYCIAAANAGFRIAIVNDAVVHHQGSLSIGRHSAERIFWATRNHLLMLDRRAPRPRLWSACRQTFVIMLNLAYALTAPKVPRWEGLRAVARATRCYFKDRERV